MIGQSRVGKIMGDVPSLQHSGQLGEKPPLAAHEDRHLRIREPLFEVETVDLLGDPLRLLGLLVEDVGIDPPFAGSGRYRSRRPGKRSGGYPLCRLQDAARNPERRRQHHAYCRPALRIGEGGWKTVNVGKVGAPEAIDRLVRVGRHGQVVVCHVEASQQLHLCVGGVLVFVDEEIAVLGSDRLGDVVPSEDLNRTPQKGSVVDPVPFFEDLFVAEEEFGQSGPVRSALRQDGELRTRRSVAPGSEAGSRLPPWRSCWWSAGRGKGVASCRRLLARAARGREQPVRGR